MLKYVCILANIALTSVVAYYAFNSILIGVTVFNTLYTLFNIARYVCEELKEK